MYIRLVLLCFFFFKQKTAYEMRISDWSSDVCSSDLNNSETNPLRDDRFSYTVLSHTDLTRTAGKVGDINLGTVSWGNYDLVVIDESHNFRTASRGKRSTDSGPARPSRSEKLIDEVVRTGIRTKVLMLPATPVNNDLSALKIGRASCREHRVQEV